MANKKISELTSVSLPLSGIEELAIVQDGKTKKVIAQNITANKTDKGGYTGTSQDLKDAIDNAVFGDLKTYQTLADFNAVSPVPDDGTPFIIANDPNEANNGEWSVQGGVAVQNARTVENTIDKTNTTKGVTGQAVYNSNQELRLTNKVTNRFEDAYFQKYSYLGSTQSPIFKVTNATNGIMSEPNELGQRNLIVNNPTTANSFVRFYLSLKDMGFVVGSVISLAVNAQSDTSRARLNVLFYDDSLSSIGSTVYSLHPASLATATDLYINNLTVPAGATYLGLNFERTVNTDDVNFTGVRINEGVEYLEQDTIKPYVTPFLNTKNKLSNYINDIELLVFPEDSNMTINSTNCVVSVDKNVSIKNKSTYKMEIASAVTATLRMDFINNRTFDKPTAIGIYFYTEDIDNISNINLNIVNQSTSEVWSRSIASEHYGGDLKKGWNLMKFNTSVSNFEHLGTDTSRVTLDVYTTGAVDLSLSTVFLEKEETGKILFVNDHGRKGGWSELVTGQTQTAIQDAEDREMPITYALNPKRIDDGDALAMDLATLNTIKEYGTSRFSFHSYNRTPTSTMSLIELKADTNNSVRWLTANGFGNTSFRAAFTQNTAPEGVNTLGFGGLKALATSTDNTGFKTRTFPLINRSNVVRSSLHGKTTAQIDEIFDSLKELGGFLTLYTHAIKPDGDPTLYDATVSEWNYFMSKIDTAQSEGWIELVSYEDLEQKLAKAGIEDNDNAIYNALIDEIKSKI
jgi:curli biogenesis system outer membrane secretion channel CsgG